MDHIAALAAFRKTSMALRYGSYTNVREGNEQLVYARKFEDEIVFSAFNIADREVQLDFSYDGEDYHLNLPPFASAVISGRDESGAPKFVVKD